MRRIALVFGILVTVAATIYSQQPSASGPNFARPPLANTPAESRILATLDRMVKTNETYLSVPPEDGRALRLLAEAVDAKNVVEIGTLTGYSGLWFCMALQRTGGHLTTFEINHERVMMARRHFQDAGVENLVTVVEGNAHEQIAKAKAPIDVAFIDAEKPGYVDYLNKVLPMMRPGGLILAHNVDLVPDYVKAVTANPALETIFYMQGRGLAVTLRKR